jgi:flagellar motor switch protein FliN/FliY
VTTAPLRSIPEIPGNCAWASLKITEGDKILNLTLAIPPVLAELASALPSAAAAAVGSASREVAVSTVPVGRSEESKTFDLLLDVELPVSVSFGRAHVPLKDVLKLTTGSIVELSRAIVEPVDVIVNNCVIAKGEVVVVEGNFGVRIQHVISRSERLRTIQ